MMGSYPLPALNVNPPEQNSPFESMGRVASLQGMLQRNKMGKMELDEATAAKQEQESLQKLYMETQGDMDKLLELAPTRGVRPQTVFKLKAAHIEQKEKVAKMDETTFGNAAKKSGIIGSATGAILSLPPEQRPQALMQALQGLVQQGVIQPQEAQQYAELAKAPPEVMEQQLRMFQTAAVSATSQFDAEAKRREGVATAQAKREELTAGQKEFADFYAAYRESEGKPKNAKVEMEARQAFKQQATSQLLTPEEEAQKKRIAAAGKAAPGDKGDELLSVTEAGALGVPYGTSRKEAYGKNAQTADMRNKLFARNIVTKAIGSLEALSKKVITEKIAIVQRTKAAGRSVDAALASDPEYRTYQDARMALAGNLAVAQQGSRPSDADVKAIWLPLVPDVFKDTTESATMKWDLIRINSGVEAPGAPQATQPGAGVMSPADWLKNRKP
jgi:hypothetical protein